MEGILEKLGWKKVAALLIAVSLFGLIFVFSSLTDSDKAALLNKKSAQNPSNNTGGTNFEITKAPQQKRSENLAKTYITPFYQISYPENYNSQLYQPSGGNILNELILSDFTNRDAKIEILTYNKANTSISDLSQPFIVGKYLKSTFANGVEFKGITQVEPIFYENIAIVEKGDYVIRLFLSYRNTKDLAIEQVFDEIVKSLQ